MSQLYRIVVLLVLVALVTSCGVPATPITSPQAKDLRWLNLSDDDFSNRADELLYADFNTRTKWPSADKMPAGFDPIKVMELGKDPGLGIRNLHNQGFTGKGVAIAIIDLTLLVKHIEYKDRIRIYEVAEDVTGKWSEVQMHGPAVASIAVGRTIGVAPDADLYYIATGGCGEFKNMEDFDFSCRAKAIHRIVEINRSLPESQKIRVLSMSFGWDLHSKGYDAITATVNEAKKDGIFVISSSLSESYSFHFHGLGRSPLSDPNEFQSYEPGLRWQEDFYKNGFPTATLFVPMDSRTTADLTGNEDYVFYREGGRSWSIPYLAGMYALAVQVKPDITPDEFWDTALKTGKTIQLQHDGKEYEFGVILDPQTLINAIKGK